MKSDFYRTSRAFPKRFSLFTQHLCALFQCSRDNGIHIVIPVFSQAPPEQDLSLLVRQRPVDRVQRTVLFIVDGIIGLIPGMPLAGVFPADNGFRQVVARLILAEGEPLVLNNPRPRGVTVGIVDGSIALKIRLA